MEIKLYNTLTKKKETFKPVKKGLVRMYVCGPTVNDVPHLGHARSQITFDSLRRFLEFAGYEVKFVSNITDIEDKIINKANDLGIDINEFAKKNEEAHIKDYTSIGIKAPDVRTYATKYVPQMIELISLLDKNGYTYVIDGDGVYYNISKFKDYGKLSGQNIKKLKRGARVAIKDAKKNKEDFVLWKFSKPGEPEWDSPWGKGRPGWHIECSAMSKAVLDLPLDIHGGGQDLIFPHHEDEIAQSEAGYGVKFANYWIHNGLVNVDKIKMSKSLGNFTTIRDLLKVYHPMTIRYFILLTHYRAPMDFTKAKLENAKKSFERLKRISLDLKDDNKINDKYLKEFEKALSDDFNTPKAISIVWKMLRDTKAKGKKNTLIEMDKVFALKLLNKEEKTEIPKEIQSLVDEREQARKNKDWKKSDILRDKIKELGFQVQDTNEGQKLSKL